MSFSLCLFFIAPCLLLSSDRRAAQAHPAEEDTPTLIYKSNMSNYSTLLPKAETITPTEPSLNISTQSKHLISASTGTPPGQPAAGGGFHTGSFIGGMMLAFIIILAVTVGYRLFYSKQEIRYRVIEEHDAII